MFNVLTDLIFLLLFTRFAQSAKNRFYFNPVLSAPHSLLDKLFSFIRPVFFSISERAISGILLLLLIVFRGAIYAKTGLPGIVIGGNCSFKFSPSSFAGPLCSLFEFLVFLTRFWGLCIFISLFSSCTSRTRVHQALIEFGKPLTSLPKAFSPIALFTANMILVALLATFADGSYIAAMKSEVGKPLLRQIEIASALSPAGSIRSLSVLAVLSLFATADLLLFTRNALLLAIFASLISVIFRSRETAFLFMELQNVILGFFGKRPLRLGMFDFTPVIFFVALQIIYAALVVIALPMLFNLTGVLQDLPPVFD